MPTKKQTENWHAVLRRAQQSWRIIVSKPSVMCSGNVVSAAMSVKDDVEATDVYEVAGASTSMFELSTLS
jgi:hypothetical protein